MIPKGQEKIGINTAEDYNEIIFPSANGMLSSISEMGYSRCELKSNVVVCHEVLDQDGGCIVYILDIWLKPACREVRIYDFVVSCCF